MQKQVNFVKKAVQNPAKWDQNRQNPLGRSRVIQL